jgi:hypothetical protein
MNRTLRYYNVTPIKQTIIHYHPPMQHFTPEELKPSEKTLNIIRQIAYTYRTFMTENGARSYCLN